MRLLTELIGESIRRLEGFEPEADHSLPTIRQVALELPLSSMGRLVNVLNEPSRMLVEGSGLVSLRFVLTIPFFTALQFLIKLECLLKGGSTGARGI